jgi:hypothetical protein
VQAWDWHDPWPFLVPVFGDRNGYEHGWDNEVVDAIGLLDAADSSILHGVEPEEQALEAHQTLRQGLVLDHNDQAWVARKFVGFVRLKNGEQVVSETRSIDRGMWKLAQESNPPT